MPRLSKMLALPLAAVVALGCVSVLDLETLRFERGDAGSNDGGPHIDGGGYAPGADPAVEVLAEGLLAPRDIHVGESGLYWTSILSTDAGQIARLHRCERSGCGGAPGVPLVDEDVASSVLAAGEP